MAQVQIVGPIHTNSNNIYMSLESPTKVSCVQSNAYVSNAYSNRLWFFFGSGFGLKKILVSVNP